jgi:hypothetical protein
MNQQGDRLAGRWRLALSRMHKLFCAGAVFGLISWAHGAEKVFDFSDAPENQSPPGFRSSVTGSGKPGDWKVIFDEVPPALAPVTPLAASVSRRKVLVQAARDATDEHFPLLIYEGETFTDFTFSTRFKAVGGAVEQMAGIAFRIKDEKNYYVLRASSLGNTLRFYKFVDGQRSAPIGPDVEIPKGVWHELAVDCRGNQIRCLLNGKEAMPVLTDNSFVAGKIGFWTKSDAVSYFVDARVTYTPREPFAAALVRETMRSNSRLVGIQIYSPSAKAGGPTSILASNRSEEVGKPGNQLHEEVIGRGMIYQGREKDNVLVTMPLRDRNGDIVAAVCLSMKSFPGQTERNAIARALPIIKEMEKRLAGVSSLGD